jgi:hypothetical protein
MNKSVKTAIADAAAAMQNDIKAAYSSGYAAALSEQAQKAAASDQNEAAREADRKRGEALRRHGSLAASKAYEIASKASATDIPARDKIANIPDGPKHNVERTHALLHR